MNFRHEDVLFALVLEKPADKRAALLDAICDGDPRLRVRLETLVAAYHTSESFLESQGQQPTLEDAGLRCALS
jgi:hypothetical protein